MPLGRLGKYDRLDVLGSGVSGIVYLARDTLLKRDVALKVVDLNGSDAERFLEEARVLDRLRHPNIVSVNAVDRIDGRLIIDMECVQGGTLQELLRLESRLSPARAIAICRQVLSALEYAHGLRTIHRDIKPANILIGKDDEVKLADFGLAEILGTNSYAGGAGTYAYMAPEDFDEGAGSDHRSDIWAVGVTLYEMVTGDRPYRVKRPRDPFAWRRILNEESPRPLNLLVDRVPPELQSVMDRALARDKRDRFASALEFLTALNGVPTDSPEAQSPLKIAANRVSETSEADDSSGYAYMFDAPTVAAYLNGSEGPTNVQRNSELATIGTGSHTIETRTIAVVPEASSHNGARQLIDVVEPPVHEKRSSWWARRREELPAIIAIDPPVLDLPAVHFGETAVGRAQFYQQDGAKRAEHNVVSHPEWLEVQPMRFVGRSATITLRALSSMLNAPGEYEGTVTIESPGGVQNHLHVSSTITEARPSFSEVAWWYLPLLAAACAPTAAAAALAGSSRTGNLLPSMIGASAVLSIMVFRMAEQSRLGWLERAFPVMMAATFCFLTGLAGSMAVSGGHGTALALLPVVITPIGFLAFVQLVSRGRRGLWGFSILAIAAICCYAQWRLRI